jgi:predicted nucleic acid-binding protein
VKIVSNSSPLIALSKIKRLNLIKDLFTSVYISEEVHREVYKVRKETSPTWIQVVKVKDRMAVEALDAIVDRGEAETIILAKEKDINIVLMDDRKGINIAKRMNLEPIRTTALIGIAYKKGLFSDLKEKLFNLRDKGYWITDHYIKEIIKRFRKK